MNNPSNCNSKGSSDEVKKHEFKCDDCGETVWGFIEEWERTEVWCPRCGGEVDVIEAFKRSVR